MERGNTLCPSEMSLRSWLGCSGIKSLHLRAWLHCSELRHGFHFEPLLLSTSVQYCCATARNTHVNTHIDLPVVSTYHPGWSVTSRQDRQDLKPAWSHIWDHSIMEGRMSEVKHSLCCVCIRLVSIHSTAMIVSTKPQHPGDLLPAVYQCCNTCCIIKLYHCTQGNYGFFFWSASCPEKTVGNETCMCLWKRHRESHVVLCCVSAVSSSILNHHFFCAVCLED